MQYRVYSGPKGSGDISPRKEQMLYKEFSALDDALSWARHVERDGRVPLLIEGDDGTRMDRRAIADALRVGQREQRHPIARSLEISREPCPFGACALGEMVPFDVGDVPIDQGALRGGVLRRQRVVRIVEIGAADGQNDAQNDAD